MSLSSPPRCSLWSFFVCMLLCGAAARGQSLTISSTLNAVTIHPGDSGVAIPVTVTGTSGPATVTLTGLPSGITVTPVTLSADGSGTILLSASLSADQEDFQTGAPTDTDWTTRQVNLVTFSGSQQATSSLALTVSLENPNFVPGQVNLPVVTINTNGVGIVDETTEVPGTITITSPDGTVSYLPGAAGSDNTATFHIHGNSTASMPKKAYHVKLNTSTDLLTGLGLSCGYVTSSNSPVCDKSKSYVLLANYDDKSLLRDWSASALSNAIPNGGNYLSLATGSPTPTGTSTLSTWAPHSIFVEMYLNGQYEGNYQLIEEVKIDSHRVNITEMTDTDTSGNALTGGYLVEIDQHQDEDYVFWTSRAMFPMGLIDPDFSPEVTQQTNYISSYVNEAETALYSADFTDPTVGWRAYFDDAAAVNFYIVNDLMGNVDGGDFYSSDYFFKDHKNNLIYMGPIWDFDISSGNVNYYPIESPIQPWMQTSSPWYVQWFKDPGFVADTAKQWNALKNGGVLSAWETSITQQAAQLEQSQQNNFARWNIVGEKVWPNPQAAGSYDAEVSYLTNWINLRIGYLDNIFNSKQATTTQLSIAQGTPRVGSSVVLTAQVSGGQSPTGVVSFLSNSVLVGAAAMNAAGTATLTVTNLSAGNDQIVAVYNGDNTNALSSSDPVTETVLAPLVQSVVNLSPSSTSVLSPAAVTLTAALQVTSGTTAPTGSVTFTSGTTVLGTATVSGGVASLSVSNLPSGSNAISASYSGDTVTAPAVSNTVAVVETFPTAATPSISPAGGTFTSDQTVTISDSLAGAAIHYTTDGSTPSASSPLYSTPLTLDVTTTVQAIAVADRYNNSSIASTTYTIPATFALASSTDHISAKNAISSTTVLTVTPSHGFQTTVSFSCLGLPAGWGCVFTPATVDTSNGAAQTSLTIAPAQTGSLDRGSVAPWRWAGGSLAFLVLMLPLRRRKITRLLVLLAGVAVSIGMSGCGSGPSTQIVSMTVQASGAGVTQSVTQTVSLTR